VGLLAADGQQLVDGVVAQQDAVGQPGERVVQRLVPELVDQAAVLEGHPRVRGHRLQQPHVPVVEAADVAHPVGDGQGADDARVATQRDHDGLTPAPQRQVGTVRRDPRPSRHHQRLELVRAGR
jgi:hypothetical protein